MKKLFILCFVLSTVCISCKNDDDSVNDDPLAGTWSLVQVNGGLAGVTDTFTPNTITYFFADGNVTVENNNTDPNTWYSFLGSGNYTYELFNSGDDQFLQIENGTYGVFTLKVRELVLSDDAIVDGFTYTFER